MEKYVLLVTMVLWISFCYRFGFEEAVCSTQTNKTFLFIWISLMLLVLLIGISTNFITYFWAVIASLVALLVLNQSELEIDFYVDFPVKKEEVIILNKKISFKKNNQFADLFFVQVFIFFPLGIIQFFL